jgi:hypothetical protein
MMILEYVIEHGDKILAIIGALYLALSIIAELTPTKKDDNLLSKIHELASGFGFDMDKLKPTKK